MSAPRPTWDEWGMELATVVARRADCSRRQVGAVVLDTGHRVISTGYNGAPSGAPGCLTAGACQRARSTVAPGSSYDTGAGSCIALHAEQNAVLRPSWAELTGATIYITDEPCEGCQRLLSGTPIRWIVTPFGKRRNRP